MMTIQQRREQIMRYVYRMREPDVVRPHEEADLNRLLTLYGQAVLDEMERRLNKAVGEMFDGRT